MGWGRLVMLCLQHTIAAVGGMAKVSPDICITAGKI